MEVAPRMKIRPWILALLFLPAAAPAAPRLVLLPRAHSHNDYLRPRPLAGALELGFHSVEADLCLVDGELRVGHSPEKTAPGRTLERLYLAPLAARVRAGGGKVYPGSSMPLILLLDIKGNGLRVLSALQPLLARYAWMLTRFGPGGKKQGAVTILLSGDAPAAGPPEKERLWALDSPSPEASAAAAPLFSADWRKYFRWMGKGPFPDSRRKALRKLVSRIHDKGRMVRFWGTPDRPSLWGELLDAGVDLIGTDHPRRLRSWLLWNDPPRVIPLSLIVKPLPLPKGFDLSRNPPGAPPLTLQAHRGLGKEGPENTLETFRKCWAMGCIPEGDIRTSADGVIFFLHDNTLERTVAAPPELAGKKAGSLPWSVLSRLDAGVKYGKKYKGERLPTLAAVFQALSRTPGARIYLDIKYIKKPDLVRVASMARKAGVGDRCIPCSTHPEVVRILTSHLPESTGMVWMGKKGHPEVLRKRLEKLAAQGFRGIKRIQIHVWPSLGKDGLHLDPPPSFMAWARRLTKRFGVELECLVRPDLTPALAWLVQLGVDGFASDHPSRSLRVLRQIQWALVQAKKSAGTSAGR